MKYTSFFVAISVILLVMGLFIRTSNIHHPRYDLDWFKHILTQSSKYIAEIPIFSRSAGISQL
jgi:hypothetical protein